MYYAQESLAEAYTHVLTFELRRKLPRLQGKTSIHQIYFAVGQVEKKTFALHTGKLLWVVQKLKTIEVFRPQCFAV